MILLIVAAAAAAADIADDHPVQICHISGFPAATCAAVKQDCVASGNADPDKVFPFCYAGDHPYGTDRTTANTNMVALLQNGFGVYGCIGLGKSFVGPQRKSSILNTRVGPILSDFYAPSFPDPTAYDTSETAIPGTSCKAPCTTAECDRFCDGAGCAASCTGSGCAGGCTGDLCAFGCTGDRCGAGAVGRMAAAACGFEAPNGAPNCGTGCVGGACAAKCVGHGCGAMCTGRYCASSCGRDRFGDNTKSIGCGAHCVGENCAYECKGLGCGVGARDKATDPFTTQCGDYKYEGHCGKLTALAGLRCAWRDGECADDPPGGRSGIKAAITAMTILTTTALVGAAVAPK